MRHRLAKTKVSSIRQGRYQLSDPDALGVRHRSHQKTLRHTDPTWGSQGSQNLPPTGRRRRPSAEKWQLAMKHKVVSFPITNVEGDA